MAKPRSPQNPYAPKTKAATPFEQNSGKPKNPGKPEKLKPLPPRKEAQHKAKPAPVPASATARPARVEPPATAFGARISRRASDRLRNGHLWVYATDIEAVSAGDGATLLPVADNRGILLGTALYSPASQIALRMVSREAIDQAQWLELLAARLRRAIERRLPFLHTNKRGSDSCRLCFSEADDLPGLVVDTYCERVVVQLLAKGLDTPEVRSIVVDVLRSS